MPAARANITLRGRGQITLPPNIREAAHLDTGNILDAEYHEHDDTIILRPLAVVTRPPHHAQASDPQ